jgi:DNA-binding transcriptional LysR family regulator
MTPTAKACQLEGPVRSGLNSLKIAVAGEERFDPLRHGAIFRLAMSDDLEALLLPDLITMVTDRSPASSVFCVQANRLTIADLLDSGHISVGVCASSAWGPRIRSRTLFESGYACVYDPEMLGRRGPLTKSDYVELPHVMISADGTRGIVDDVLDAEHLTRRRVASTAHFAMVPLLLSRVAAIATMPRHAAKVFAAHRRLEVCDPPIPLPRFTVSVLWHENNTNDPRVMWMIGALRELADELMP